MAIQVEEEQHGEINSQCRQSHCKSSVCNLKGAVSSCLDKRRSPKLEISWGMADRQFKISKEFTISKEQFTISKEQLFR